MKFSAKPIEKDKSPAAVLLRKCLSGDARAQMEVYKRFSKAMFNTAFRLVNDAFEAEDLVQESFLTAFDKLSKLQNLDLFPAWLKQIVIRNSINRMKQLDRSRIEPENFDPVDELDAALPSQTVVSDVQKAIQSLPDGYRAVFSLNLLEGYDHEEIAQILGITASSSRSQLSRAKKQVKEILIQHYETEGIYRS